MKTDQGKYNGPHYGRRKEARTNITNGNTKEENNTSGNQASTTKASNSTFINSGDEAHMSELNEPIVLEKMVQGSVEWHNGRRGCITMSHGKDLISKGRKKGEPSITRRSYLVSVASEIITGVTADSFKSWAMERGNILEPYARDAYRQQTGQEVREVGMGYLNSDKRISGSPDGLGANHGMEIKCQLPKNHLNSIVNGFEPKEFDPQMQGNMWIFQKEYWEYVSFCPEFKAYPLFVYRVVRDEEMIKAIEESALKGVYEIDEFVRKGRDFEPSDKIIDICKDSLEEIEALSYNDPEFS